MGIPVPICEIMAGDWRLLIEKDGEHFAASVIPVYGSTADYRIVLADDVEKAISSACAFIEGRGAYADAAALRDLARAEVKKNIKQGDET
jgi:hypothetical protein